MPRIRASPVKISTIPLNDDASDKRQRLHERKLLQSKQRDQLKAAASPARREGGAAPPLTPSQEGPGNAVAGAGAGAVAVTPMKRVPILANFEEWMKMATDNKINAANSWNFALIDYFHDMSLLKDGDAVNFQKASCTLDGCVKIYTSRVDSVATETGKLLSGLAESGHKKRRGGDEEQEGDGEGEEEEDGEGEDGVQKPRKKKAARSAEATLAASFEQLRLKKMELEFSVDPLFKKAAADFDEGGAKGLLMNHLSIDGTGRIVFDSSDDAQEDAGDDTRRDSMEPEEKEEADEPMPEDGPIDLAGLAARFFPDLNKLEEQDICPSLKTFELGNGNGSLDLPFLKAPDNWRDEHPEPTRGQHAHEGAATDHDAPVFAMDDGAGDDGDDDDDDDDAGAGFDMPPETGFGEGGEAWARNAALQPQMRVHDILAGADEGGEVGTFDTNSNTYGVTLQHRDHDQENILNYFDTALHKNWAGPEHWKIAKIKEANKAGQEQKRVRKEKEPFEIDFMAPMTQDLANLLGTKATSNSQISLPKNQWRSKTRNLLPDDKHFNSKDLLKLFLKPKAKLGARKSTPAQTVPAHGEIDEAYWAAAHHSNNNNPAAAPLHPADADDTANVQGDYDANFFQDDNLPLPRADEADDDDDFADARDHFSPQPDDADAAAAPVGAGIDSVGAESQAAEAGAFGAQLVTQSRRLRPEYVQYARVAKKVDVRRLKENLWAGIGVGVGFQEKRAPPQTPSRAAPPVPALEPDDKGALRFSSMMNHLQHVYPKQQLQDISTSYGFICLLHLANEKGLVVENVEGWTDLRVRRDVDAVDLELGD